MDFILVNFGLQFINCFLHISIVNCQQSDNMFFLRFLVKTWLSEVRLSLGLYETSHNWIITISAFLHFPFFNSSISVTPVYSNCNGFAIFELEVQFFQGLRIMESGLYEFLCIFKHTEFFKRYIEHNVYHAMAK